MVGHSPVLLSFATLAVYRDRSYRNCSDYIESLSNFFPKRNGDLLKCK